MELLPQLTDLGFTEYEARVYLDLLGSHPATGYQISKRAGIPRSMVYEALGRLKARGAVLEASTERVTNYRPMPPDVLLDEQEQAYRRRVAELRHGLSAIYQNESDEGVWTISGGNTVLSYAEQMIRQVQGELYLVLDDPTLEVLRREIAAAHQRNVALGTVLTGQGNLTFGQVVRHPPLESQLHQLGGIWLVVADGKEALVVSNTTGLTATATRSRNLVLIARQFVWMELFAQRIFARLGPELLDRLDPQDRQIFELAPKESSP